jgi:hypothetical protein
MSNVHYFRSQAELYFELARRMSIRADAEYCRVTAERYAAMAAELGAETASVSSLPETPSADRNMGADHAAVLLPRGL